MADQQEAEPEANAATPEPEPQSGGRAEAGAGVDGPPPGPQTDGDDPKPQAAVAPKAKAAKKAAKAKAKPKATKAKAAAKRPKKAQAPKTANSTSTTTAEQPTAAPDGSGGASAAASSAAAEGGGEAVAAANPTAEPAGDPAASAAADEAQPAAVAEESEHDRKWRARLSQPVHPPTRGEKLLYAVIHTILVRFLSRIWFRLEVVDRDFVPAHGPFVVAPVHRSNIDFFLVAAITRKRMRYIGKDSLWKFGPLGRFIGMLGAFPVRRGGADREALRTCMQIIENGEPLVIFPEGTRQSGPKLTEVFDGPAYIATRTGVPLVPVGIGGTEKAMPKGAKWIKPRKVVIVVGEPLNPPPGNGTGRAPRRVVRELTDQLKTDVQALFDEAQQRAGSLSEGARPEDLG